MKYLLTALMVFTFITIGCKKSTTESNNNNEITEYSTVNVKTATEYFSFADNSGSTNESEEHDIVFYSILIQPEGMPFPISDPHFKSKDGLSIAVIEDTKLEDVTDVPNMSEFVTDYTTETESWYYMTDDRIVLSNESVWVVNTADGKFPAFVITNYYDEQGESGVYTIEWKYLSE